MNHPTLHRIEIFPIKSLDGISLDQVSVLPSGALKGDRQYAIVDEQGHFVNGKSTPLVHQLRATFSADLDTVTLQGTNTAQLETFSFSESRTELDGWLSEYFGQPVTLQENQINGFPDDLNAPGPTLISDATLTVLSQWFPDLDKAELRRRFRTNLEISAVSPFWEDQLFGVTGYGLKFWIGNIALMGTNPCQRCVVPTRSSLAGEKYPSFQKQFVQKRAETLPHWAPISRFNHFYKLAVNTRITEDPTGLFLRLGDLVVTGSEMPAIALEP